MSSYNWRHHNAPTRERERTSSNRNGGGSPLRSRKNLTSPANAPTTEDEMHKAAVGWPQSQPAESTSNGRGNGNGHRGDMNVHTNMNIHTQTSVPAPVTPETPSPHNMNTHGNANNNTSNTSTSTSTPFDENKPTSPATSAKNARNFWQQKASKSWKPPSSRDRDRDRNGGNGNGNGSVAGSATGSATASASVSGTGSVTPSTASSPSRSGRSIRSGTGSAFSGSSASGNNVQHLKSTLFSGNMKTMAMKERERNARKNLSQQPALVEEEDLDENEYEGEMDGTHSMGQSQSQAQAQTQAQTQTRGHEPPERESSSIHSSHGKGSHNNINVNHNSNSNSNSNQSGTKSNRSWIKNLNSNGNINRDRFIPKQHQDESSSTPSSTPSSQSQTRKKIGQPYPESQPQQHSHQQPHQQGRQDAAQDDHQTPSQSPGRQQQQQQHPMADAQASPSRSPTESPRRQKRPSRYQQRQQQIQQHHQHYEQNHQNYEDQHQNNLHHHNQHHHNQHQQTPQASPGRERAAPVSDDGALGEMQIKLDIAAAKLLTEEMKQKDLAEQLEAAKSAHDQEVEAMLQEINTLRTQQNDYNSNMNKQSEEVEELYVEIERLHESARAERNLVGNQQSDLQREKNEAIERNQALEAELEEMRKYVEAAEVQLADVNTQAKTVDEQDQKQRKALETELKQRDAELKLTEKELKAVKKDIDGITNDFRELADETERLEIELEAVTEDRDELLRRSVLYHNQAQSKAAAAAKGNGNSSNTTDGEGNEVVVPSSLNESSRLDYEIQQQQAELTRLRTALHTTEENCRQKDEKIQELESAVEKSSKGTLGLDGLDLSDIEVENMSYFTEDNKQEIFERFEEHIKSYQGENAKLNNELNDAKQAFRLMEEERDNLKVCLADAMQELEEYEISRSGSRSPSPSPQKNGSNRGNDEINDVFTQELIQIIREKDTEIEKLTSEITRHHLRTDVSSESFQEELNNVVEWLNSSTRINGSPSIEIMIRDKHEDVTLQPEDEEIVQNIHDAIKTRHYNVLLTNAKLKNAKKEVQRQSTYDANNYDEMSVASFERNSRDESIDLRTIEHLAQREANEAVRELRVHVKACRDEANLKEQANVEIRKSLNDAADLIKPLKEHVTRIEHERTNLEEELSAANKRLTQLQTSPEHNRNGAGAEHNKPTGTDDQVSKLIPISPLDLRKKDEQIIELKIEVNQVRDQLKDVEADLAAANRINKNGDFDEMPTPTKSNRSQLRSDTLRQPPHGASMGDDEKAINRMESEILRLNKDLKKKISAEETLKVILSDSSNRLAMMSNQAESLANEKNDAESRILVLEKENVQLETQLKSIGRQPHHHQSTQKTHSGTATDDTEKYKQKLEEAKERVDRVSIEAAGLKAELKKTSKERKKMKKHLEEAVGMLNSLRNHVETSEKERKTLKRHLRTLYDQHDISLNGDDMASAAASKMAEDAAHVPDPDHMENTTTILHLRSHIVKLEHEIRNLEERIGELEATKPPGIDSADDPVADTLKVRELEDKIRELNNAHKSTKELLHEVSQINKEMLNDLKQTEAEAAETLDELDILKRKFTMARDEIDNAKYIASSAIRKLNSQHPSDRSMHGHGNEYGQQGGMHHHSDAYGNFENVALTDCINQLEMRVSAVLGGNLNANVNMNVNRTNHQNTNAPDDFWSRR